MVRAHAATGQSEDAILPRVCLSSPRQATPARARTALGFHGKAIYALEHMTTLSLSQSIIPLGPLGFSSSQHRRALEIVL